MNKTADPTCSNIHDAIASVDRACQFIYSRAESESDQEFAEDLFQASTFLTGLLSDLGAVTTALESLVPGNVLARQLLEFWTRSITAVGIFPKPREL